MKFERMQYFDRVKSVFRGPEDRASLTPGWLNRQACSVGLYVQYYVAVLAIDNLEHCNTAFQNSTAFSYSSTFAGVVCWLYTSVLAYTVRCFYVHV